MSSRIEQALGRLDDAVAALEQAGLKAAGACDSSEVARLSADLEAVRADYEALQLTSQQASGRIDAAISRLRAVLEV
ncbi:MULTISPECIES: hypothetical protein [unclassified Haematospirillum]|uniref:hypothetical protein n=1 Tax=unclassified Haematospirillum TaxID=2622088 RepID=UPI001439C344|nr:MULTISPECIES: hypothetical protein [unclassified Haematospirillum]NKD54101.1 hypothetical protein [Haematospirillum sp. H4890]NKD74146.1 hypothetical protein [Haematospirillum sp. H4485]NKD87185.1 hypothetical protein [Haematospirillum sp. 15-248]